MTDITHTLTPVGILAAAQAIKLMASLILDHFFWAPVFEAELARRRTILVFRAGRLWKTAIDLRRPIPKHEVDKGQEHIHVMYSRLPRILKMQGNMSEEANNPRN